MPSKKSQSNPPAQGNWPRLRWLEPHDVIAAIDVHDFSGDGAGEVAGQKQGRAADFQLVHIAAERGAVGMGLEHVAEIADAARGESLDRAGGNGVDANVPGAEVPGEIADRGFESGLGHGHDVVVGDDLFGGIEAERKDAAALGHERRGGASDGNERIDADVMGDAESLAAGVNELAAQLRGRRKGHGVDEDIQLAVLIFEGGEEGFNLLVVGNVTLEAAGAGQLVDEALRLELHAVILIADDRSCSGLMQFLRVTPGNGTLVGQPEDYSRLTCQIDHARLLPPGPCVGDGGPTVPLEYQPPRSTSSTLPVGRLRKREPRRSNFSTESVAKQRTWSCMDGNSAFGPFTDGSCADGERFSAFCWPKSFKAASAVASAESMTLIPAGPTRVRTDSSSGRSSG